MESYTLSPRLQVIADFAKEKEVVADIGCDHGKISIYLAKDEAYVHAVDISMPSLNKARKLAEIEGVKGRISFYCDNGLDSINDVELDAVIIAGMGWRTISSILESNLESVKIVNTVILQPMDSVIDMREWLCRNSFNIINEKLVWDEGRLYTIIVVKFKEIQKLTLKELLIGPKIIENEDDLLKDLAKKELNKRKNILSGLRKAMTKNAAQIEQIKKEIEILKLELKR